MTYGDAIEQFNQLGFTKEITRIIVNLAEHHVLNQVELPLPTRSQILASLVTELSDAARKHRVDDAVALSQALRVRMFYWKGTARMRHATFSSTDDQRLDPHATDIMFFALQHIADALEHAAEHTTLYQHALTPP